MKKYCCGYCSRIAEKVYNQRLVCQTHNPKETIKTLNGMFLLPDEPFEYLPRDLIKLPPSL